MRKGKGFNTCTQRTKKGKSAKIKAITDAGGLVLSVSIPSAAPHEVGLVKKVVEERLPEELPKKLSGDWVYDTDPLDEN